MKTEYDPEVDSYNDVLWKLWEHEFAGCLFMDLFEQSKLAEFSLRVIRREAAIRAFCQLVGTSCLLNVANDSRQGRKEKRVVDWNCTHESNRSLLEDYPTENAPSSVQCLEVNIERGPEIEACPWLQTTETDEHLAYYLWDVRRHRTVKTSRLNFSPTYTAISHTWGRWC